MTGDSYRIVTALLWDIRPASFLIERANATARIWIPRSLIHAASDQELHRIDARGAAKSGEEFTFRLRAWKAEELGLAGVEPSQGRML